jgi:exportin-1
MTTTQIARFVEGLFDVSKDLNMFKELLRDFLITVKEFESEDNSELYLEEAEARLEISRQEQMLYRASVPGLLKPDEVEVDPDL